MMTNNEDLHCGIVYIPPYHSKYAHTDPYLELQNKVDKYMISSHDIILFGDFDSRTSSVDDFRKFPKCSDTQIFVVIILKLELYGSTIEYWVQTMQTEWQTV